MMHVPGSDEKGVFHQEVMRQSLETTKPKNISHKRRWWRKVNMIWLGIPWCCTSRCNPLWDIMEIISQSTLTDSWSFAHCVSLPNRSTNVTCGTTSQWPTGPWFFGPCGQIRGIHDGTMHAEFIFQSNMDCCITVKLHSSGWHVRMAFNQSNATTQW